MKDETHTNHVVPTNNVNRVHIVSSNPDISEEEETSACAGSSSSKEDNWNTAQTILNILLKNPQDFELKSKPSGIRDNRVFTLNKNIIPVESAKADDNGGYIYKGNPKKFYHWDLQNAPRCCHHDKLKNCWVVKEKDPTSSSNFVDVIIDESQVYDIKRSYRQNKYNPWLTNIISQAKPVSSQHYHHYYLMIYKTASQEEDAVVPAFIMPRHGNAINPWACAYYRQDSSVKETIDKRINLGQSNDRIYVDLASKEKNSLSETVTDPKVISNQKYASKEKNQNGADVNKDTDAECIVRYIKRNDSYIKSFHLDSEQYSAVNYLPHQLTDIKRFCVEDTAVLSVDTTFEICDGFFLTDISYPNLPLLDKRKNNPPQFPGPSFWHFKKNEEAYQRFAGEMVIAEPSIANVQKVGHDLDKSIAKGA